MSNTRADASREFFNGLTIDSWGAGRQEMGRAQMPLWVQLRRREIERQGEEEVTASLQLTRRRHRLGNAVSS